MRIKGNIEEAVAYARCSTEMQDGSVEQQRKEISEWAEKNGIKISAWYIDEGKSGTSFTTRPGFMRLLKDVEGKHNFSTVLTYDESRWSRAEDPRESNYWKFHFKRFGVTVVVINSQSKNGNDVGSVVVEIVEAAESSEHSKKISRATKRGQKANASNGYSSGGTAPFGYKRIAVNKTTGEFIRELPPGVRSYPDEKVLFDLGDPSEVLTVKRIFNLKLQGLGCRKIADILNSEGVPCPKRGRWKNKDQKWSETTLRTIITNPAYAGKRIFNRHPQSHLSGPSKEVWFNDEKDWIVKENAHPAIIPEKMFNEANKSNKTYQRTNRFYFESPYLLTGIIKCKACGYNYQGQTKRLISKKSGTEYKREYYQDSGYNNKGNVVCKSFLLRKDVLEAEILKQIKRFIKDKKFLENLRDYIDVKLPEYSAVGLQLTDITKKIESNRNVLKNLLELVRNGVSLKEVQDEIISVNKEIDYLERNLDEMKSKEIFYKNSEKIYNKIKKFVANFEKTLLTAPLHVQKSIIRQFMDEILVDPHSGIIECKFHQMPWTNLKLPQEYFLLHNNK